MPNEPIIVGGIVSASGASAPVRLYNETTGEYTDINAGLVDGAYSVNLYSFSPLLTIGDVFYIESRDGVNFGATRYTSTSAGSTSQNITLAADSSPSRSL